MNTDGTLVRPPVWTGANAGSACISVYPFLSAFICVSTFLVPSGTGAVGFTHTHGLSGVVGSVKDRATKQVFDPELRTRRLITTQRPISTRSWIDGAVRWARRSLM